MNTLNISYVGAEQHHRWASRTGRPRDRWARCVHVADGSVGMSGSIPNSNTNKAMRPWLGLRFLCAGAYTRVYHRPQDPCYNARCPGCGQRIRIGVGQEGRSERMYEVDCGVRRV